MIKIDWSDRTNESVAKLPINYDLPLNENAKIIANWLRIHKQKNRSLFVVMYHATGKNVPVTEQGLLAGRGKRKNFQPSESGYVYLSPNPNYAKGFGNMAFPDGCVVYEVIVPVKKLLPDKRHFYYAKPEELTGSTLANSLVYGGSARIKGNIERWQIKKYKNQSLMARLEQKKAEIESLPRNPSDKIRNSNHERG